MLICRFIFIKCNNIVYVCPNISKIPMIYQFKIMLEAMNKIKKSDYKNF